jgi:hypothetical protein
MASLCANINKTAGINLASLDILIKPIYKAKKQGIMMTMKHNNWIKTKKEDLMMKMIIKLRI